MTPTPLQNWPGMRTVDNSGFGGMGGGQGMYDFIGGSASAVSDFENMNNFPKYMGTSPMIDESNSFYDSKFSPSRVGQYIKPPGGTGLSDLYM